MIVSSEIILLGDGLVFAHESSKPIESHGIEDVLSGSFCTFRNTFTAAAFEA